ncbi:MAG: energy transducer TonB [Bacteroidales bacterium]|nr:energy transducer TonB [Bacteroidales bacterium]
MAKKGQLEGTSINSLDDIVFEHRNKDYGVYQLRKKYKKYLLIGFAIAFLIFSGAVAYPLIEAYKLKSGAKKHLEKNVEAVLENLNKEDMPPPPPPPPPPAALEQQVKFKAPVVVDTVKEEVTLATIEEQKEIVGNEAPPEQIVIEQKQEKETIIEDDGPAFVVVEENATFQGGDINSFRIWVQQNIVYPTAAAEAGISGKVIVQFAVNSRGQVVDVKVLRGVHPELDKEAVRCILSSPRWSPGKQGGKAVKQQFVIPIVFTLQ